MSNRKFKIREEGYWSGNRGDCCETDYFPTYCISEELPDGTEEDVYTNGTAHELEDAYHGLLEYLGVKVEVEYSDS
jgi:hypothetical protein